MIRYDPEAQLKRLPSGPGQEHGHSQRLGWQRQRDQLMSDLDPEVVRLIRDLLIHTDRLGVGHQTRAENIAHQLNLAEKVILDKDSVPEWMELKRAALTGEAQYRLKNES